MDNKNYEDLRREILDHKIPRVPQSILDGSMTLKEFAEWAETTQEVQARDDLVIREWLTPYIKRSLNSLSRKLREC